jgi:hypothetical protein
MSAPSSDPTGAGSHPARPQYGEYATPAEQRAHIQQPTPHPVVPAPVPAPTPTPTWGAPSVESRQPVAHPADRIATIAMLGFGAVYVLLSMTTFLDLPAVADEAYRIMGITTKFTNVDAARLWGIVAAIVLVVGYLATAFLALRSLRRGRLAWWIPLVGAAVTFLVVYVCIAIPLLGDPAFTQFVVGS